METLMVLIFLMSGIVGVSYTYVKIDDYVAEHNLKWNMRGNLVKYF